MNFDLFKYLTALVFLYAFGRLFIHYFWITIPYIFSDPIHWDKKVEKPRLFVSFFALGFLLIMSSSTSRWNDFPLVFQIIGYLVLALCLVTFQFTWSAKFESAFDKKIFKPITAAPINFNISITENQMSRLYNQMVRFDLIVEEKTSFQDFCHVLKKDWNSHQSKIYFKIDAPSCREFYEYLKKTYPKNSLSLKNFFETSNLIIRPDGKNYKYNTIKNAPTRTPFSKLNKTIEEIFSNLS